MTESQRDDGRAEPAKVVARMEVATRRFLDAGGTVVHKPVPDWAEDRGMLAALYRNMVLTRTFDTRAINLQRTGNLGTYASTLGQEAVGAGVASATVENDVIFPTYREYGAQLWRGVTPTELFLYWGGDERGSDFAVPRRDFPICIPIATHMTHAVGAAYAMKLRGEPRVAVCFGGDGSTSKGDFYEAMNAAGVWQLPVVFAIANNQWAISVSRAHQTHAETIAQKSVAAGIPGVQVDGNDVIAVRDAALEAAARAREGGGPTLIEMLTYRMGDHTTADDASRYRSEEEVEHYRTLDPVRRMRAYMEGLQAWSEDDEQQLVEECKSAVDAAAKEYMATESEGPEAMFDHLYETLPSAIAPQRLQAIDAHQEEGGDDG